MNTWQSWAHGSASGVVLHSVPPLLVFVAAEAVTDLRDKLTDAATVAVNARMNGSVHAPVTAPAGTNGGVGMVGTGSEAETAAGPSAAVSADSEESDTAGTGTGVLSAPAAGRRRGTFDGYREAARRAWSPGVVITPAWIREVTGCSRGLSSRLAATLNADLVAEWDQADGEGRA